MRLTVFFVGGFAFSLNAGIKGLAWSQLLASAIVFVIVIVLLTLSMKVIVGQLLRKPSFSDFTDYLRVGVGSGLDSLVRNVAYLFMILSIINSVGSVEIGGYYLFIQIFWGFLLVSVLSFVVSARVQFANKSNDIKQVRELFGTSLAVVSLFILVWIALTPA